MTFRFIILSALYSAFHYKFLRYLALSMEFSCVCCCCRYRRIRTLSFGVGTYIVFVWVRGFNARYLSGHRAWQTRFLNMPWVQHRQQEAFIREKSQYISAFIHFSLEIRYRTRNPWIVSQVFYGSLPFPDYYRDNVDSNQDMIIGISNRLLDDIKVYYI